MRDEEFNVSIIIPAFNEEDSIGSTLSKLCNEPKLAGSEIIVVDDGSVDFTGEKVSAFKNVQLVQHHVNKGYSASLATGTRLASRNFVFWFDADGQHRVEDLLAVIQKTTRDNLDYCIGIRNTDSYQVPSRKFGKWLLKHVVQLAAGQKIEDFNSGLRGFRTNIVKKYLHLLPKGFGASTTTTLLMLERNYKGAEIPITVLARVGKSSVRQFRDGFRTLLLILRIFLLFKPLQFFGMIGLLVTVVGFGYGMWTAIMEGLGFPVLGAVAVLFGVQVMFLGLLMDQISALRRERFD